MILPPSHTPSTLRMLGLPLGLLILSVFAYVLEPKLLHTLHYYQFMGLERALSIGLEMLLWLCGAFFIDQVLRVLFFDGFIHKTLGRSVPDILKSVVSIIILISTVLGIISVVFDKQITGVWATSSVAGIVLGIAVRPLISDIFSGLASNIEGAFHIGEWVTIDPGRQTNMPYEGWIAEIGWRTTRLKTRDGNIAIVPNSILASAVITNHAVPMACHRQSVSLSLGQDVSISKAKRILESALLAVLDNKDGPLELPSPEVQVSQFSSLGVQYTLLFWTDSSTHSPLIVQDKVLSSAYRHLQKAGIQLAFPKEEITLQKQQILTADQAHKHHRLRFIETLTLFSQLNHADIVFLSENMICHHFSKGHVLFHKGDMGASMFILAEGLLCVTDTKEDGIPIELGKINPGEFFGEMSLLTGAPRSATITARTESIAYEINKELLKPILSKQPFVMELISQAVSKRQYKNNQILQKTTIENPTDHTAPQILEKIRRFFGIL